MVAHCKRRGIDGGGGILLESQRLYSKREVDRSAGRGKKDGKVKKLPKRLELTFGKKIL